MGDVGPAPQHLLAACGLLSGRTVAGLNRENGGAKAGIGVIYFRELLLHRPHDRLHVRVRLAGMFSRHTGLLRLLDVLGPVHIGVQLPLVELSARYVHLHHDR